MELDSFIHFYNKYNKINVETKLGRILSTGENFFYPNSRVLNNIKGLFLKKLDLSLHEYFAVLVCIWYKEEFNHDLRGGGNVEYIPGDGEDR